MKSKTKRKWIGRAPISKEQVKHAMREAVRHNIEECADLGWMNVTERRPDGKMEVQITRDGLIAGIVLARLRGLTEMAERLEQRLATWKE